MKGLCLAKGVARSVFKAPLNFSKVEIPTAYED
jgi:hypothetical protein